MTIRINVIDPDVRRRAAVAHHLSGREIHAEIYEDIAELAGSGVMTGLIFMSDSGGNAVTWIEEIREAAGVLLPVIVYADDPSPEDVVDAMRAGALDYLKWPFSSRLLGRVFHRLAHGEDRVLQQELLRNEAKAKVQGLTGRENDVLTLLVHGLPNKGIARVLGISPRTVEIHRANMMGKLGAQSAPDAVRIGVYAGLDENTHRLELMAAA
jgi:FixJ family two-component response regulator